MESSVLKFLGSDSGFGANNNSAYIEEKEKLTIIDCGFTVFTQIKKKFDLNKYKEINVIITHLHNDHAGSLSQLILYSYFIFNKKVNVISMCSKIKEYLDITGTPEDAYTLYNKFENVEFIRTEHTRYLDSCGFKLCVNGKKIVYTGDTNILEPFIKYTNDIDEFYVDVSRYGGAHLKIDDVIEKLREIKKKKIKIYLMHIDDRKYIEEKINNEFYFA
mgnify:CR=1 FL=1